MKHVASIPTVMLTMDMSKERAIIVCVGNGKVIKFQECEDGLYHYDTTSKSKSTNNSYMFVTTVAQNKNFIQAVRSREQNKHINYNNRLDGQALVISDKS